MTMRFCSYLENHNHIDHPILGVVQACVYFYFTEAKESWSVLQKSHMSDKDKSKWMAVLNPSFISSDHSVSGTDSEDDTLVVQP